MVNHAKVLEHACRLSTMHISGKLLHKCISAFSVTHGAPTDVLLCHGTAMLCSACTLCKLVSSCDIQLCTNAPSWQSQSKPEHEHVPHATARACHGYVLQPWLCSATVSSRQSCSSQCRSLCDSDLHGLKPMQARHARAHKCRLTWLCC